MVQSARDLAGTECPMSPRGLLLGCERLPGPQPERASNETSLVVSSPVRARQHHENSAFAAAGPWDEALRTVRWPAALAIHDRAPRITTDSDSPSVDALTTVWAKFGNECIIQTAYSPRP